MTTDEVSAAVDLGPVGTAYSQCRQRIAALVAGLDDATTRRIVPPCPEWSVHDVVAHVAGVVDDALAGRLDGVATDPWTAAQVESRRDRPVADIVAAWNEQAPQFEALLDAVGPPGAQAVADLATHEHDIRCALGRPGGRDSDAVGIGLGFVVPALRDSARQAGAGVPGLHTPSGDSWAGDDDAASLTASPFELLRACTGRRSLTQLRALPWTGDAGKVIPAFTFGPFTPASTDIIE